MFKFKRLLCASIIASTWTPMALAQSTSAGSFTTAPFVVGDQSVFVASILNLNLQNFFGGGNSYLLGNNYGPANQGGIGTKTTTFNNISRNLSTSGTSSGDVPNISSSRSFVNSPIPDSSNFNTSKSSLARSAFGTNVSTSGIFLVLTALTDSNNPRTGSAGALFQGLSNTNLNSVSFQYAPVSTGSGFSNSNLLSAPYLVIDDVAGGATRTRYLPITAGSVVANSDLNTYNNLNTTTSTATAAVRDNALLTVTFNAAQLGVQGNVSRIGLVLFKKGIVFVNNISVNGVTSSGFIAQNSNTFPF